MKLLVAIDMSQASNAVVAHARAAARALNMDVEVTRVLDPLLDLVAGPESKKEIVDQVANGWRQEMDSLLSSVDLQAVTSVVVLRNRERVHQAIVRRAEEIGATMIAIGTHGASMLRRAVLGSVAMGVVRDAGIPVMAVGPDCEAPSDADDFRILATCDDDEESGAIVGTLSKLAEGGGARVTLLTVYEPRLGDLGDEEERERLLAQLEAHRSQFQPGADVECAVRTLEGTERVDSAIIRIARELDVEAIAMATQGYSARRQFLTGSVGVGVLKHATVPVILVKRS